MDMSRTQQGQDWADRRSSVSRTGWGRTKPDPFARSAAGPAVAGAERRGPEGAALRRRPAGLGSGKPPSGGSGGVGVLLTLGRARDALGLEYDEFDVAVQIGEVPTVVCGPRMWKVRSEDVDRLRAEGGHPLPLRERVRLVGSADAAKQLGVGRERFVRLARTGFVRPVRWYANRYHALVWMYLAQELPQLAEQSPALMSGPLPEGLREAVANGEDERARGWRARRVAQLVRDSYDVWEEAAVWSALLGPELIDSVVPDPDERSHLRKLRAALPPGRPGLATPEQIRSVTTADHPDEIALALMALADALGRARELRPAPRREAEPEPVLRVPAQLRLPDAPRPLGTPRLSDAPLSPDALGSPDAPHLPDASYLLDRSRLPGAAVAERALGAAGEPEVPPGADEMAGRHGVRGLLRLLGRGRRSAGAAGRPAGGGPGRPHNSPTSVNRSTARPSSSDAARSTSAEMPQP
jgi:hypothetical protein